LRLERVCPIREGYQRPFGRRIFGEGR